MAYRTLGRIFFLHVLRHVPRKVAHVGDITEFIFFALHAFDGMGIGFDAGEFDGFVVATVFTVFVFEGKGGLDHEMEDKFEFVIISFTDHDLLNLSFELS